jgi:DNA gyrase subunit A
MLLTAKGQSVRCPVNTIREVKRGGKGVKLLTLAEGDKLLSIAKIVETEAEQLAAADSVASVSASDSTSADQSSSETPAAE